MKAANKALLGVTVAVLSVLACAGSAFAGVVDPTIADQLGDAIDDGYADTSDFIITRGVPVVVGGIVLGLIIRLAFRWMKRAGRAVG